MNRKKILMITIPAVAVIAVGTLLFVLFSGAFKSTNVITVRKEVADALEGFETVYPQKITGNLDNPGMGWVSLEEPTYEGKTDLGYSGDLPEIKNISLSTSWAHIETAENVFDWTGCDAVINYWKSKGKRINLRICTDTLMLPYTYKGVPDWLIEKYKVGYEEVTYDGSGPVGKYKILDIRNEKYLERLRVFLNALSEKYKDVPEVDVVEIRGFGVWGEWHSGHSFSSYDERMASLSRIIDEYSAAFQKTNKLLVLCAAWEYKEDTVPYVANTKNYDDYIKWSAFDHAMQTENTTFRRDAGAAALRFESDKRLLSDFMRSGKRLPLLGEYFGGPIPQEQAQYGFNLMEGIDDILFNIHANYCSALGWVNSEASWVIEKHPEIWARGNEKFGYRLAVDYARYPQKTGKNQEITLLTRWSNSGVGRFWYNDKLKVYLLDKDGNEVFSAVNESFDVTNLLSGQVLDINSSFTVPDSVKDGEYSIAVAIIDASGNPHIKLGMAGGNSKNIYTLGKITVDNSGSVAAKKTQLSSEELLNYKFSPNTTYSVTFTYVPTFSVKDFQFGSTDGYIVKITDGEKDCYNEKWQDVSQKETLKTIVFATGAKESRFEISSQNYGDISIKGGSVEQYNSNFEDFESYDFNDYYALYLQPQKDVTKLTEKGINKNSIEINTRKKGHIDGLELDKNIFTLKPNTTYTVSFKAKTTKEAGNGGYMYVRLKNSTSYKDGLDVLEWLDRSDIEATYKTVTFTTDKQKGTVFAIGMHNIGGFMVDDLLLIEHESGDVIKGENIVTEANKPKELPTGIPAKEGFENLSFAGSIFNSGANGWGRMTTKADEVISGKVSLLGEIEPVDDGEWVEFAQSRVKNVPMKANTAYRVTFQYKILQKASESDGFFYFSARSATLGVTEDVGFTKYDGDIGKVYEKTIDFVVKNADDYYVMFGMHRRGKIVIDDFEITELGKAEDFNGKINFENGSIALSHCTGSTQTGSAVLTSDKDKVVDGKYSVLGDNSRNMEWFDFLYTLPDQVKIKPNTTYELSFDYKIIREVPADSVGFQAFVRSYKGGLPDVGTMAFKGKAGETGTKSLRFTTKDFDDYFIAFDIHKGGAITIDNIELKETNVKLSTPGIHNFERGSIELAGFKAAQGGTVTKESAKVLSGNYSVLGSNTKSEWFDYLYTDSTVLKFEKNTTYEVTFKYKIIQPTPDKSSGFQVFVKRNDGENGVVIHTSRWKGNAGDTGTKTIRFTTDNHDNYYLAFGMHYSGEITIDDIDIEKGSTISTNGLHGFERGNISLEGFTSDTTSGTACSRITEDAITGKYAVLAENPNNIEWFDFLISNPSEIALKPMTRYTVSFRYKIIKNVPAESAGFQFFCRSQSLGVISDVGTKRFDGEAGETGIITTSFVTKNVSDYSLVFGMHFGGSIIIDDIQITEK